MASDLAKQANEAFVDDDYALAVDLYSQAIELDPKNAHLFADRAQANIKLEKFTEAVADASKAIALDPEMAKAYLRKGIACIKLEEYQTAKAALEKGAPLADGDSRFLRLIKDCDRHIEEETEDFDKLHVTNGSTNSVPTAEATSEKETEDFDKLHVTNGSTNSVPTAEATSECENKPEHIDDTSSQTAVLPKPKFRHDFYNSQNAVVVTIFAKGIPANNVIVDFGEQILSVTVEIPGEEAYVLQPRLFAKIIPDKCKYLVLSTKIEIHLAKAEPIAWTSLEFSKEKSLPQRVAAPIDSKPAYPYSKTKVDWDKLESQVKKEEKEEKLDGDAALNKFFREIYQDADEDMRRAMSKSFVESNGTVLSTNWKEVGVKKVEGSAPDGMELKKWEY